MVQVTYRVIHLADGQVEGQADGAEAVSVVTGYPTITQAATPPVTQVLVVFNSYINLSLLLKPFLCQRDGCVSRCLCACIYRL